MAASVIQALVKGGPSSSTTMPHHMRWHGPTNAPTVAAVRANYYQIQPNSNYSRVISTSKSSSSISSETGFQRIQEQRQQRQRQRQTCLCGCPLAADASGQELGLGLRLSDGGRGGEGRGGVVPNAVRGEDRLGGGGDSEPESSPWSGGAGGGDEMALRTSETAASTVSFSRRFLLFKDAFWRFLRPHTIRGTLLGSTALVTRALVENPQLIDWVLLPRALRGVLALLCGNGYIVGINQIYDVGIDKINKPFLPIAAGDLSLPVAWVLVLGLATLGIGIVASNFGPLITKLYSFGLFLGTVYSVPLLHLKRFAVPAFLIIATVRGFLLNFGVYFATRAALGLPFHWSPSIIFITAFVTVFATVIAITKDLPDVEGDQKFKISTFATTLGVRNISFVGSGLLLANYVGAIVASLHWPHFFNGTVMVSAHAFLAAAVVYQTWLLDSAKYTKDSIAGYYRFIWNLFYTEYFLLPFI